MRLFLILLFWWQLRFTNNISDNFPLLFLYLLPSFNVILVCLLQASFVNTIDPSDNVLPDISKHFRILFTQSHEKLFLLIGKYLSWVSNYFDFVFFRKNVHKLLKLKVHLFKGTWLQFLNQLQIITIIFHNDVVKHWCCSVNDFNDRCEVVDYFLWGDWAFFHLEKPGSVQNVAAKYFQSHTNCDYHFPLFWLHISQASAFHVKLKPSRFNFSEVITGKKGAVSWNGKEKSHKFLYNCRIGKLFGHKVKHVNDLLFEHDLRLFDLDLDKFKVFKKLFFEYISVVLVNHFIDSLEKACRY